MPLQDEGLGRAQTLIWTHPPFARSTLKSLPWSWRLLSRFLPHSTLTRDELSFSALPSLWPKTVVSPGVPGTRI